MICPFVEWNRFDLFIDDSNGHKTTFHCFLFDGQLANVPNQCGTQNTFSNETQNPNRTIQLCFHWQSTLPMGTTTTNIGNKRQHHSSSTSYNIHSIGNIIIIWKKKG